MAKTPAAVSTYCEARVGNRTLGVLLTADKRTVRGLVEVKGGLEVGHVLKGGHERTIVTVGEGTATSSEDTDWA